MSDGDGDPAATPVDVTGSGDDRALGETVTAARPVHPYVHVVIVALLGAVAVFAWLWVYEQVNRLLWENAFVTANPWMFPVICLPFSLLVGLLVKFRHAPTMLGESMLDSLSGDVTAIKWRTLPLNVVAAWASLFSGAVIGPEGGIGGIASKIAALYGEKVGIPVELRSMLVFSTISSAYNGLVASPLFSGVLGAELPTDPKVKARTMPASLIGGAIGYLVFFAAGSSGLQNYLHLSPDQPYTPLDVLLVVVFGLLGLVLALVTGALFRAASAVFGRFEGREVERALLAGVIFSAVGVVAPILLFSGETQVQSVVANPAAYGPAVLVGMALVKLALLAVAFKSGFLGGPTFPAIFAAVCVALALNLVFPGVRIDVLIGGIMAGSLFVLFKAPLMVILLTAVMLQAGPELTALIVLAVTAVMITLPYILAVVAGRQAAGPAQGDARPRSDRPS